MTPLVARRLALLSPILALLPFTSAFSQGDSLKTDLVSYWPFDEIQGTKTPDLASGYDLTLEKLEPDDLILGFRGNAFRFTASKSTYLFRTHAPGDDLPANKHNSFTVSFWVNANFSGQSDKRLFSEGSNTNNNPLFTIGTTNNTSSGAVDLFVRQAGTTLVEHEKTTATPLDGNAWHHIVFVQSEADASRTFYIDGVADATVFTPKSAGDTYNMNITSFGAVLRTDGAAWINGDIDEAAIWKRPLTEIEILDLRDNGMPDLTVAPDPLAITSFERDFRAATMGDTVRLRWDVTKDATITITPGIGDVTGASSFGVGNVDVTVTEPATYTLTITRGEEDPVVATVSVEPREGIAAGWRWIEDFEGLEDGAIGGQARWLTGDGAFNVGTLGASKIIRTSAGVDLTAINLRSLTLIEGSSATMFFRFCLSALEPEFPIDIKVGLTEKTIRFQGDFGENIGTYIILSRAANEPLKLQAIDGIDGAAADADFTFEPDRVYNVWLDINNTPLGSTDTFSVHVAEEGGTRTTVFDNIESDREPQEVPLLGFPQPDIDNVFVVASTADQSVAAIAIDDFFISPLGTFTQSVPTPARLGKFALQPFEIVNFLFDFETGQPTLEWNSKVGDFYSVWTSRDLQTWREELDGIPANVEGPTTVAPELDEPLEGPRIYFQIRKG